MLVAGLGLLFLPLLSVAQFQEHAIGLRLSGDDEVDGVGVEISYQHALGGNNRAELDLGLKDSRYVDAVTLTGIYQWVWNLEGGFNWFVGPGVGLGVVEYGDDFPGRHHHDYSTFFASLDGDIGIEYIFNEIPLQLALDLRPEVYVIKNFYDDFDLDWGFAIRYQF